MMSMDGIHAIALNKFKNKQNFGKSRVWIGGMMPKTAYSKEHICFFCDGIAYFSDDNEFIDKKHIKVCPLCAVMHLSMPHEKRDMLYATVMNDLGLI
jgi:hypothetical protein